jgi:low molecular weight phosphotyrosine protein phosphatase
MDRDNLINIQRVQKPGSKAVVKMFGEYSGTGKVEPIEDPYYGGSAGFELAYQQIMRFTKNFLEEVFPDVKWDQE